MRLLVDTHVLVWSAAQTSRLSKMAARLINDLENDLFFSVVSLWEIAIKQNLGRNDFNVEPSLLRQSLKDNGYAELNIDGRHAIAAGSLPLLHRNPFDRMLVAQAIVEGAILLTSDALLQKYPAPVRVV